MDKGDCLGEAGEELVAKGVAEPNDCVSIAENMNRKAYSYTPASNNKVFIGIATLKNLDLRNKPRYTKV
jgi:hypothetical protein